MITSETVKEFQEVVESEFGEVLNVKEAEEILLNCVGYFDLIAKINHRNNQVGGSRQ